MGKDVLWQSKCYYWSETGCAKEHACNCTRNENFGLLVPEQQSIDWHEKKRRPPYKIKDLSQQGVGSVSV